MKVVSFNINSIRARLHQLQALIELHSPDVISLQETKVADEQFPEQAINDLGYHAYFHGQKSHYGVATLTKSEATKVSKGFTTDTDDSQRRFIATTMSSASGPVTVYNGYFPQGESRDHPTKFPNKRDFYRDLISLLNGDHQPTDNLIVVGDMNIAPADLDIGIGEDNRKRWLRTGKSSFLPEERQWLETVSNWGLTDTFRHLYPNDGDWFSWFDYRSRGFEREPKRGLRIDLILASDPMLSKLTSAGIDYDIRGLEKPSDHAPIWAQFDL